MFCLVLFLFFPQLSVFGFVLVMVEEGYLGNYTFPISVSGSEWFEPFNSRSVYLAPKVNVVCCFSLLFSL